MTIASKQGGEMQKEVNEFRQHDVEMLTALEAYEQQFQSMADDTIGWIQTQLATSDGADVSGITTALETRFSEHSTLLKDLHTRFQNAYGGGTVDLRGYSESRQVFFSIMILVVALFAIVVAFLVGGFFTRPVLQLAEIAHKMSQGDFDYLVRVRARDELGSLNTAFIEVSH